MISQPGSQPIDSGTLETEIISSKSEIHSENIFSSPNKISEEFSDCKNSFNTSETLLISPLKIPEKNENKFSFNKVTMKNFSDIKPKHRVKTSHNQSSNTRNEKFFETTINSEKPSDIIGLKENNTYVEKKQDNDSILNKTISQNKNQFKKSNEYLIKHRNLSRFCNVSSDLSESRNFQNKLFLSNLNFLFTGFYNNKTFLEDKNDEEKIRSMIRSIKFHRSRYLEPFFPTSECFKNFNYEKTVLISKTKRFVQNFKTLATMAKGVLPVHISWLEACLEEGKFENPKDFLLFPPIWGNEKINTFIRNKEACLFKQLDEKKRLFRNRFYLIVYNLRNGYYKSLKKKNFHNINYDYNGKSSEVKNTENNEYVKTNKNDILHGKTQHEDLNERTVIISSDYVKRLKFIIEIGSGICFTSQKGCIEFFKKMMKNKITDEGENLILRVIPLYSSDKSRNKKLKLIKENFKIIQEIKIIETLKDDLISEVLEQNY